jgi:short-subunit dehydrogenase
MLTLWLLRSGTGNRNKHVQIRDQVVLLTGASEGIGASLARQLRARGARLALVARNESRLRANCGPGDLVLPADLTRSEDRERAAAQALDHFGRVDILVNNAGIGLYCPSWLASDAETRTMFELNLHAPLHLARLLAPGMRERRRGMIVNVSSIGGKVTLPWLTLYSASKYALGAWSDGLRMELLGTGVHVLTVCPGYVRTNFQSHVLGGKPPAALSDFRSFTITSEECAAAAVRGIERDARTVLAPRIGWLFVALARLFPGRTEASLAKVYRDNLAAP